MGRHHGSQTCIGYRGYRCDCLHGLGPGGTPAFDPNDCDDFSWCAREKTFRRGGSFSYVLATVCKRHRHQVDSAMKASETALGRGRAHDRRAGAPTGRMTTLPTKKEAKKKKIRR